MTTPLAQSLQEPLRAVAAADPHACLGGASALAVHLGLAPAGRIEILVSRSVRTPSGLAHAIRLRRGRAHSVETLGGVRVEARLEALVRVLASPGREHDARLLAATAQALSPAERSIVARRAARVGSPAAWARAAFLAGRAHGVLLRARPASAPVWLRPGTLRLGPVDVLTGVRINAPPAVPLGDEEHRALGAALAGALAPHEARLVQLAAAGLPLDAALAEAVFGPGPWPGRLTALTAAGVLAATTEHHELVGSWDVTALAPLPADALARGLAFLDAHAEAWRRAAAVDARIRAGSSDAVSRVLAEAPLALERGEVSRVEAWLGAIEPLDPPGALAMRARVHERRGHLVDALDAIRTARSSPGGGERMALVLEHARLAWRAGRAHEARAALREVDAGARRAVNAPERVDSELLRAAIAAERGDVARARTHLSLARGAAERSGDDEALARVLRRLGALEARAGRPGPAGGAYRAALVALRRARRVEDRSLEATLLANLATTEAWLGRHAEAHELYAQALAQRAHQPIEALNTRAALALLEVARGLRSPGGAFGPLSDEAERLGEPRLRAELAAYRASELVWAGRLGDAERALTRARTALAELGGAEVVLVALSELAEGALRARRGEHAAHGALSHAVDRLAAAGARYHAARAARDAAAAMLWLGDAAAAMGLVEQSARLADGAGLVLGLDPAHAAVMVIAALRGRACARRHASEVLERAGTLRVAVWLRRDGHGRLADEWAAQGHGHPTGAPYQALGPDGALALSDADRRALLARHDVVILDRVEHRLHVLGAPPRAIGRMRLVEPLLAHLSARRPEPVPLDELARLVWAQRSSRSVVAAITTSIARLRALLVPAALIRTVGTGDRRGYAIAAEAPLYTIERRDRPGEQARG